MPKANPMLKVVKKIQTLQAKYDKLGGEIKALMVLAAAEAKKADAPAPAKAAPKAKAAAKAAPKAKAPAAKPAAAPRKKPGPKPKAK